jgi:hypothetical protein
MNLSELKDAGQSLGRRLDVAGHDLYAMVDIATAIGLLSGLIRHHAQRSDGVYTRESVDRTYRTLSGVEQVATGVAGLQRGQMHGMLHLAHQRLMTSLHDLQTHVIGGSPVEEQSA